ncbi:SinI family restriction endonuclease [Chroogloeocystis siderophila]|jgi:hypothetical protein|uniref:SinI family restriction endonuclease n=1 Tax=Chroogloeocystis siderophila 5.2 s.c.1 TaxID=247279 RepID=A0A1U7HF91_9CHRO|nr:SinI family restriction endonuclease [Chroogloeocystis siderophila]OKH22257.1 hypothetical protein NIES1031_20355 [Chroogloeocystis siderophila 5.2 s.c.1]
MPVTFSDIITACNSEENFLQIFQNAFSQVDQPLLQEHRIILTACYRNPGLSLTLKGETPEFLAQSWLQKYCYSFENRISRRISQPPRTVADPIVDTIIKARLTGLTEKHLEQIKYAHRLSMSAENIQGLLLEEFLAEQLADYGWYCCWGEVIRHVDFCHIDGSLLQVKNRSNSENSSSSRVRINQPIEKWHRVDAKTGLYKWSYFNTKYNTNRFSEENFILFVQKVLLANPSALALEANNPWQSLSQSSD